jgi:hypothetical protein
MKKGGPAFGRVNKEAERRKAALGDGRGALRSIVGRALNATAGFGNGVAVATVDARR